MTYRMAGAVKVPVIDLTATGQNIKRLRVAAGISVRDLQMILGFTNPQAIYKWQNGDSLPTIDNLVILAAVLGVTVDEILPLIRRYPLCRICSTNPIWQRKWIQYPPSTGSSPVWSTNQCLQRRVRHHRCGQRKALTAIHRNTRI